MNIATKVIFASALMLSVVAPTLSYAAYFVDETKTWALEELNTRAQDVMGKKVRVNRALDARAYAPPTYSNEYTYGDEYFRERGIINQH
jgi:hypothetical protein